jgi:hypothetical protein
MANRDGIIVISRALGLRKTSRKAQKMMLAVSAKLSVRVGSRLRDLRGEYALADQQSLGRVQGRLLLFCLQPDAFDEFTHCARAAEQVGSAADAEPHAGKVFDVNVVASGRLGKHDLLEVCGKFRPGRGV